MVLDIEREWGKWPGWFGTLPPLQRATLLGLNRAKQAEAREREAKRKAKSRSGRR